MLTPINPYLVVNQRLHITSFIQTHTNMFFKTIIVCDKLHHVTLPHVTHVKCYYNFFICSCCRQVIVVLTQLEGNDGFSVSHRLNFRTMTCNGNGEYGAQHMPELGQNLIGLHSPRPIIYPL